MYPAGWDCVTCYDWYENEEFMWLCLSDKNGFCKIDKKNSNVTIIDRYPIKEVYRSRLSLCVIRVDDILVFSPCSANAIAILDLKNDHFRFKRFNVDNRKFDIPYSFNSKFYKAFCVERRVFFFGLSIPMIMIYDLDTDKIFYFDDWADAIVDKVKILNDAVIFFTDGIVRIGEYLYAPLGFCNGILKIHERDLNWEYIEIPEISTGILGMTLNKGKFILTEMYSKTNRILQYDLEKKSVKQLEVPIMADYYHPIFLNDSMYLFSNPYLPAAVFEFNQNTQKWQIISKMKFSMNEKINSYTNANGCIVVTTSNGVWRYYNVSNMMIDEKKYSLNKDLDFLSKAWEEYSLEMCSKERIIKEGHMKIQLDDFLNSL